MTKILYNFVVRIGLSLLISILLLACACEEHRADLKNAKPAAQNSSQATAPVDVSLKTTASAAPAPSTPPAPTVTVPKVSGEKAMQYTREVTAFGSRPIGSAAHKRLQAYLRDHLKNDNLEEDTFTAQTPAGPFQMTNFIAKFPGTKDGIVVISGHYDTVYSLKNFVGANDGGSSTGLPLALADVLRQHKEGRPTVWLVWFDGEEAVQQWSATDSTYGSRHLAQKWQADGTLPKIKAFLLLDMIGDADLDIQRESNSTSWVEDMVGQAASKLGYSSHFFAREMAVEDDHLPFVHLGVPSADIIDLDYGPNNSWHHTSKDTIDKVSPKSMEIVGNVVLQVVWDMK